ncbi:MAG: transcriptional regulator, partial [Lachnospiraceae bacterium]|nr:transcriptional regulator [Lachnospiraceae bacterium]
TVAPDTAVKETNNNNIKTLSDSYNYNNNNAHSATDELFEYLWTRYPNKKGKGQVSEKSKKQLLEIGRDEMERAVERYKAELKKDSWRQPQNGSTFFNSGYIDYLDANYMPGERPKAKNDFLNHEQSTTDYAELERLLE